MTWHRVSKEHPCLICGKPDWCTASDHGSCCMRVQSGRQMKNGGWFFSFNERKPILEPVKPAAPVRLDVKSKLSEWLSYRSPDRAFFAASLGVKLESLVALGCIKAPYAHTWAFPMVNGNGDYTGIRLRSDDGKKWSERGSKQGIFLPKTEPKQLALVCEGPTDCAAGLTLGFWAVGRPSCCAGVEDIGTAFLRLHVRRAVVIADNDDPGLRGARQISDALRIPTAIIVLPSKDLRSFLNLGGTHEDLNCLIQQVMWRQPNEKLTNPAAE